MEATGRVDVTYVSPGKCSSEPPSGARQGGTLDSLLRFPSRSLYWMRSVHWLAYEAYARYVAEQRHVDIFHESFYTPARIGTGVTQVFTLHDLSLIRYPETHSLDRRLFFERFFESRLNEADAIIVPSLFVKQELCDYAGKVGSRAVVIPEGVDACFGPRPQEDIREVLENHGLPSEYGLFVGTLEPRKNLSTLLNALTQSKAALPLVIVGWSGWGDPVFRRELNRLGLQDRVYFPGYLSDEELACVYCGADVFFYPSLYEGFGLPVLEAMACGTPVVCSDVASIPEVAGDAAVRVSPHDPAQWADAMDRILQENDMNARLVAAGMKQAAQFTWENAANQTLELYAALQNS